MTAPGRWGKLAQVNSAHYPQPAAGAPVTAMRGVVILLLAFALAACAGTANERPGAGASRKPGYDRPTALGSRSNEVLMRAIGLVGTPYRVGGNTPEGGFDCSGLVDFVFFDAAGLRLPRSTRELIVLDAPTVSRARLAPGDLVFFNPGGGPTSHIGIYVGESRFVHAPRTGGTVRLESLDSDYWTRYFTGAKRVLR